MGSRFDQDTEHAFWVSAALKQLTAASCHYNHTYVDLPFTQASKCPTLMRSKFDQDTQHAFWVSAALQNQLTAAFCRYSHTYATCNLP